MKKVNITTAVLLIYLIVMSIIGWPGKQADPDYVQYFGVIGDCSCYRPIAFPADQTTEDWGQDERRKKGITKFNCKYKILIHEGPCDRTVSVRDG